jgi:chromosomal replication initiation ATPase DnaA
MQAYTCYPPDKFIITAKEAPAFVPTSPKPLTLDDILHACADLYQISIEDIISKKRDDEIIAARHTYCYLSIVLTRKTPRVIGVRINRERSTIVRARESIRRSFLGKDRWSKIITSNIQQLKERLTA